MERHKCKLCSRTFANGRALGGHMKAHLATFPLPPKPQPQPQPFSDNSASLSHPHSSSYSFSYSYSEEALAHGESQDKGLIYGLRENPKKSFRFADPEFSFPADTGSVVQDRESETESKKPTRRRSKRTRKSSLEVNVPQNMGPKRPKLSFMESPEPVSSVSDTSPEQDVAMCLMMLSRDTWSRDVLETAKGFEQEIKLKRVPRGKRQCHNCGKTFRSSKALGSHKGICLMRNGEGNDKIFECPFCFKVFGSGQALGGHKRSHLIVPSSSPNTNLNDPTRLKESFIDLNLPAPPEDDNLSVVSDA